MKSNRQSHQSIYCHKHKDHKPWTELNSGSFACQQHNWFMRNDGVAYSGWILTVWGSVACPKWAGHGRFSFRPYGNDGISSHGIFLSSAVTHPLNHHNRTRMMPGVTATECYLDTEKNGFSFKCMLSSHGAAACGRRNESTTTVRITETY